MTARPRNIDPETSTPNRLKFLENFINQRLPGAIANTVKPIVSNLETTINNLLAASYWTISQTQSAISSAISSALGPYSTTSQTNSAINSAVASPGAISPTTVSASGSVSGTQAVFPTGVRSTGARNNQVTTGYVAAYIDSSGNLGYAPSTRASKDIGATYAVNMSAFLSTTLYNWQYKNGGMTGIGPIADDLQAAGLTEFLTYDVNGNLQGLRYEALTMGLWSAYVQSRMSTLARIAKQAHQVATVTSMTALSLGGTKAYTITWPTPFADADYLVSASVVSSTGVVVAGASAAVLQSSKTAAGCTVNVAAGVAILAGQTLTVEGIHV